MKMNRRMLTTLSVMAVAAIIGSAAAAVSLTAPKWVAVLYVDAQKAVGLRWMPVAGAVEYQVLRSEIKGKDHKEIAKTAQPQYFDRKIEHGSTYYYILRAVSGSDVGPKSEEKKVVMPGQKQRKSQAPTGLKVKSHITTEFGKTSYKAGATWDDVPGAVAYNVYRRDGTDGKYELIGSTSERHITDSNVKPGETYDYYVTALDSSFQESPPSNQPGGPPGKSVDSPRDTQALTGFSNLVGGDVDEIVVIEKAPN